MITSKRRMSANSLKPVNRFDQLNCVARGVALVAGIFIACASLAAQTVAQPKLPVMELRVGGKQIHAEIADDEAEREVGLMFRKSLAGEEGMLFVMPQTGPVAFWMKNTSLPLTIAYLDTAGTIMELHDLEPHNEKVVPSQFPNITYALEMPRGWFTKNNIWPGEAVQGLPKRTQK